MYLQPSQVVADSRNTNGVANTLNTVTLVAGAANTRHRLSWVTLTINQQDTGIIVVQIRDNVTLAVLASLAVSPQTPSAFIQLPEPGNFITAIGSGIQASNISNVATQGFQMQVGYYIDTVS